MPVELAGEKIYLGEWRYSVFESAQPTLDELMSSAGLNRIGSPQLRNRIQEYLSEVSEIGTFQTDLVQYVQRTVDKYLNENFEMSAMFHAAEPDAPYDFDWHGDRDDLYDMSALDTLQFRNILVQLTMASATVAERFQEIRASQVAMIRLIDQRLGELGGAPRHD